MAHSSRDIILFCFSSIIFQMMSNDARFARPVALYYGQPSFSVPNLWVEPEQVMRRQRSHSRRRLSVCPRCALGLRRLPSIFPKKINADILPSIIPRSLSPDLLEHKYPYVSMVFPHPRETTSVRTSRTSEYAMDWKSPPANSILSFSEELPQTCNSFDYHTTFKILPL